MADLHSDLEAETTLAGQWFDHLRQHSKSRLGVTRASYGDGEQMAHNLMQGIGQTLGLEKRIDPAGNLYLTLPGLDRSLPAIMTGSHLDSVPEGGNYDGAAGVVAGMAMLVRWRRAGRVPKQDITVMGVRAEELSWFPAPYIGSRAAFGLLEPEALDNCKRFDTGRSLAEHMTEAGFRPDRIRAREPQLSAERIRCFLELHIEQGPVLVAKAIPVGIVTGIRGNIRYRECHVTGRYGHAGAELVSRLEQLWVEHEKAGKDLVTTVGRFHTDTEVHTMTKIPGEIWFSMDIRSEDNDVLLAVDRRLRVMAQEIGARRNVAIDLGAFTNARPGPIDPGMRRRLEGLARALDIPALSMASGAGHDAAVFANQGVPTAMIFVRNEHGSHNPDEAMELADFALGLKLLVAAVEEVDGA